MVFSSSQNKYRNGALKLYVKISIFLILLIFFSKSHAATFLKVGKIQRLSFEGVQKFKLNAKKSSSQGGGCGGRPTEDLILQFDEIPAWVDSFDPSFSKEESFRPCEVKGSPLEGGQKFELRISYFSEKGRRLEAITYASSAATYVDQWMVQAGSGGPIKKGFAKAKSSNILAENLSELFDNNVSWQKITKETNDSMDLNSPGLDKFRDYSKESNPGILKEPIERLPLRIPSLDLPMVSFVVDFEPKKLPLEKYNESDLTHGSKMSQQRKKVLLDALNLILLHVSKKDWARAFESISILEKSQFKAELPVDKGSWWALKGFVALQYSEESFPKKQEEAAGLLEHRALEDWREGIRRFSGLGGENQEYAEFMIDELVRILFKKKLPFAALGTMIWAQKFSWTAVTEERFEYLKALALENLSLFDEAESAFREFFKTRSALSSSVIHDRRLVPAAALWPGDIALKLKNFPKALEEYNKALSSVPSAKRFSFEKVWLPEFVKQFPEVLMNRAEVYLRLGQFANAIKDYRAFVFVAPTHPAISLAYYRIGDSLALMEADQEKAKGAWRECVFRFKEQVAGPLCLARMSALQLKEGKENRIEWPRLIADIEDAQTSISMLPKSSFNPDDLKIYLGILFADAFIARNEPNQALFRLDPLEKLVPSPYLSLWFREYRITALLGSLEKQLQESKARFIISEYENRRRSLFLYQTRAEALLLVSRAYAQLGLWKLAQESLERAFEVKKILQRPQNRPYDPNEDEWLSHQAVLAVRLFSISEMKQEEVESILKTAPVHVDSVLRARILYSQLQKNLTEEIQWWEKLEEKTILSNDDLLNYVKALELAKKSDSLKELLERRVGAFLAESQKPEIDKKLSTELFLKLAELRKGQKDFDGAMTVVNYLLTLPPTRLHVRTPRVLLLYQKALLLKEKKNLEQALNTFREAELSSPDSIWAKLSKSNATEIEASLKRKSENR